jgi:queuine/archaeosine tRNA-ribosyltransferase
MDKSEKYYLETLKEMKEMKRFVKEEIDSLYADLQHLQDIRGLITELQEEVAKLAGEPVGMLFSKYRA